MPNFLNKSDIKLSQEFEKKGYIIRNILNKQALRKPCQDAARGGTLLWGSGMIE